MLLYRQIFSMSAKLFTLGSIVILRSKLQVNSIHIDVSGIIRTIMHTNKKHIN